MTGSWGAIIICILVHSRIILWRLSLQSFARRRTYDFVSCKQNYSPLFWQSTRHILYPFFAPLHTLHFSYPMPTIATYCKRPHRGVMEYRFLHQIPVLTHFWKKCDLGPFGMSCFNCRTELPKELFRIELWGKIEENRVVRLKRPTIRRKGWRPVEYRVLKLLFAWSRFSPKESFEQTSSYLSRVPRWFDRVKFITLYFITHDQYITESGSSALQISPKRIFHDPGKTRKKSGFSAESPRDSNKIILVATCIALIDLLFPTSGEFRYQSSHILKWT